MDAAREVGVLVVGHGWEGEGEAEARLEGRGRALGERLGVEVEVGFLKGEGRREGRRVEEAMARLRGGQVVVVPWMMAHGWLVKRALPRRLGVGGGEDQQEGEAQRWEGPGGEVKALWWGRALGVMQGIGGALERRLEALRRGEAQGVEAAKVGVVVVGHGTERASAASGGAVWAQVEGLRRQGRWAQVEGRFLDQEPRLSAGDVRALAGEVAFVVPFMAADGPHTLRDIPQALGRDWGGKRVVCGGALGEASEALEVAVEEVTRALAQVKAAQARVG